MTGLKWSNKLADKKRTISDIDAKEEFFIFLNCEWMVKKALFMFLRLRMINTGTMKLVIRRCAIWNKFFIQWLEFFVLNQEKLVLNCVVLFIGDEIIKAH